MAELDLGQEDIVGIFPKVSEKKFNVDTSKVLEESLKEDKESKLPAFNPFGPSVYGEKLEKAKKLYSQAFKKFDKAYLKDKKNPDILNYLGYTSRKSGNFSAAEDYYLKGLSINPKHNGINEYLGELYVQTNRIDKANERLEILKNCNCDEYKELELIIKTRGTKIY